VVRALRDGGSAVVHTGSIESLRREKDDAQEVREGFDCGIMLATFSDLREGDVIEAFRTIARILGRNLDHMLFSM
jgi:translation initiation factor IF-2